jgi:ribonuclease E
LAPVLAPVAPAPAPAEKGFFGWIKNLFGGAPQAPAPVAPAAVTTAPKTSEREPRPEGRRDGGRDARGGKGRDNRNNREGGRNHNARPIEARNGEARSDSRRNDGPRSEARNEPRGEGRNNNRRDNRRDATGIESALDNENQAGATTAPVSDTMDSQDTTQRRERRPRNDNRRRQPGNGLPDGQPALTENVPGAETSGAPTSTTSDMPEARTEADALPGSTPNGGRERRSRDRYGRDRRERAPRETNGDTAVEARPSGTPAAETDAEQDEAPVRSYFSMPVPNQPAPVAETAVPMADTPTVQTVPAAAPAAAPMPRPSPASAHAAPVVTGMPKVQGYDLSIDALSQMARQSGLEWVNSDAEKIASAQAAIAAEPRPIHVPREPKPPMVIDEGPLVLVETRKDLAGVTLPFESR